MLIASAGNLTPVYMETPSIYITDSTQSFLGRPPLCRPRWLPWAPLETIPGVTHYFWKIYIGESNKSVEPQQHLGLCPCPSWWLGRYKPLLHQGPPQ